MSAIDPVIHAPNRLQIACMLAAVDEMEFAAVRETVGVSESVLSKHVKTLEEAGYLTIEKRSVFSRQRTWLRLTPRGRQALKAHMAALRALMAAAAAAE